MDEVYEEIKEAGNYVVDGVEKTLTDAANYVEDVVAPAPPVARTLDPAHPAPPPLPDEFEQRDGLGLSRDDVLKAPAAAEADKRWDYKKMYARRVVVQCPVLAVALYVAVAQFYDVEARLALARSLDLGWAFLAWYVVYLARQSVAINAAACRAGARCPRPDQHVYRIAHPDFNEKPYVMMANAGPQGRFNRAQRAVFNYDEALPLFLSGLLLNALLGPAALVLAVLNCVEIKILRRVRPESPRRPPRHRVRLTHWLISTQVLNASGRRAFARAYTDSLEGRGGGFVRAVAPEHVSAALNLVIAALIFAPRFDIDVPAPPKFLP